MERLTIILLAVLLSGCGARRKTVESIKTRSSYEISADSAYRFLTQLHSESLSLYNSSVDEKNRVIEYNGQPGDSLQLEEYGHDGMLKSRTVVKGKGKAVISEGTKFEQLTASEKTGLEEHHSGELLASSKVKSDTFQEALDKNVSSSGSILQYWWILVFVLGALWYLNKRYGWWTKIKSHVTASKQQ